MLTQCHREESLDVDVNKTTKMQLTIKWNLHKSSRNRGRKRERERERERGREGGRGKGEREKGGREGERE